MALDIRPTALDFTNRLDRFIGWLSPSLGLRRLYARTNLTRAYEAASPRDPWKPRRAGASANADHLADASKIRAKARNLVQNVPYIANGMRAHVANVIGTGITQRWPATNTAADLLNTLWKQWIKVCDADGQLDYYGLQRLAKDTFDRDGELLVRLRPRFSTDPLPVPLQLQLLEIDWLDSSRVSGGLPGNHVINGIEYDQVGQPAAYWLWSQHPGDIGLIGGLRMQSKRVPADQIIHLFAIERPGQGRGFSRLAPVISRTRDLQLYEDAELARKNLEARLAVLASGDITQMTNPAASGELPDPTNAKQTGELGQLASGSITMLPAGMNMQVVEPKAAPGYVETLRYNLHLVAAGAGWTYESMVGDVSGANFSSSRVRINDYRRQCEQEQWLDFIPRFCERVSRAFVNAAQLAGKVQRPDYAIEYSTPKPVTLNILPFVRWCGDNIHVWSYTADFQGRVAAPGCRAPGRIACQSWR
jgi:lambda family phage portal protein